MRPLTLPTTALLSILFSAGLAAGVFGGPAHAAPGSDDPEIKKAFAGTIVSTYPDGRKARLWLNPDGSYTAAGRRNDRSSGRWTIKGEKVCLKQSKPFSAPFAFCTPKPAAATWNAKAFTGEPIKVRLVDGGRPS
jgi:hypothetical protein